MEIMNLIIKSQGVGKMLDDGMYSADLYTVNGEYLVTVIIYLFTVARSCF